MPFEAARLYRNGYGVSLCRAMLKDAALMAAAIPNFSRADYAKLIAFTPKERDTKWHAIEFIDHTAEVIDALHFSVLHCGEEPCWEEAADRAVATLLERHRPRGVLKWWNIFRHGGGLH